MSVLEIQEMNLRIPGVPPEQAQEIGQRVVQILARRAESLSAARTLGRLDLKIRAPEGQTPEMLAETIVQAILDQIER